MRAQLLRRVNLMGVRQDLCHRVEDSRGNLEI
jgi:hypothetical protein